MKIVCQACEVRAAEIVCSSCAGQDAAFCVCANCDYKFHATPPNLPLKTLHQRHLLSSSTNLPMCDACKMVVGFFFCLEERKMLCRECDASKHVTAPKSTHQRVFLPGVEVGPPQPIDDFANNKKKPIDVPESSSHAQLIMPSTDDFFEFEGNDTNGLHGWADTDSLLNGDVVEGAVVEGDAEHLFQEFHHLISDDNNNNSTVDNTVDVVAPQRLA